MAFVAIWQAEAFQNPHHLPQLRAPPTIFTNWHPWSNGLYTVMRNTLLWWSKKTFCEKLSFSKEETLRSSVIPPNFVFWNLALFQPLVPAGYARKCELAGVRWCPFLDQNLKYSYPNWIDVQCLLIECVGLINIGKVSCLCQSCISLSWNVRRNTGQKNALSYESAELPPSLIVVKEVIVKTFAYRKTHFL